jgi:hypothetical protein
MESELYVLFRQGDHEWYEFEGTLDEAIKDVKTDRRWCNYGRRGALIIRGELLYEIGLETVERRYITERTYVE